jgi:cardiolipin synthase
VSDLAQIHLPWWAWTLLALGTISLMVVISALFLPELESPELKVTFDAPVGSPEFVSGLSAFLNVPVLRGGTATILQNGDTFFSAILEAIRNAKETVNFQTYIFEPKGIGTQFIEAFKERARAGVEVRVLVDAFGSMKLRKRHRRELAEAGCRVKRFRPIKLWTLVRVFKRDHRRAIVVDGRVGFTGGASVAEKWTGDAQDHKHWRDNMLQVTGPLAHGIQTAFGENWVYCTDEIIAGTRFYPFLAEDSGGRSRSKGDAIEGDGEEEDETLGLSVVSSPGDASQPIRFLFWLSLKSARERILISSSYFVPDKKIRGAVADRARAGVDVRILVPGENTDAKPVRLAGRGFYEELLSAGVRIFEYRPTMMHAKTVVVDGIWSIVGSSNMDERSTAINEENNMAIRDPRLAAEIEKGLFADMEQAEEIDLEEWRRRSVIARGAERLASLLLEQY